MQFLGHNPLKERCDGLTACNGIEDYFQNLRHYLSRVMMFKIKEVWKN